LERTWTSGRTPLDGARHELIAAVSKRKGADKSPQVASLEEELSRAIGTRVRIRQGKGKGAVSVEFYTNDDFERIRKRFDGGTGPLPAGLTARAESLFAELLASSGPPVVLHGDLHHGNILSATRAPWLAIDPKGVVGEAEYEAGALLANPSPEIAADPAVASRRIAQLGDLLGFDRQRIRDWAFAQAVLRAWWGVEDRQSPNPGWLRIAETLAAVPA